MLQTEFTNICVKITMKKKKRYYLILSRAFASKSLDLIDYTNNEEPLR